MRYGEITRLRALDFNREVGNISVSISKSGKPRHIYLTEEGRVFFEQAVADRPGTTLIFVRADGEAWGTSHQFRPLREACATARIEPPISFHILRHTYASRLALAKAGHFNPVHVHPERSFALGVASERPTLTKVHHINVILVP